MAWKYHATVHMQNNHSIPMDDFPDWQCTYMILANISEEVDQDLKNDNDNEYEYDNDNGVLKETCKYLQRI